MENDNEVLTSLSLLQRLSGPAGDPHDWKKFVDRYQPLILKWARRKLKNPDDAEDVTASVLEKLFRALPQFEYDPKLRFRGWLRTVVKNAVCDFQRRQQRRSGDYGSGDWKVQELLECIPSPDDVQDLVEQLDETWEQQRLLLQRIVERVQRRVEPLTWKAYQLYVLQSEPADEVARQLGLSTASVYAAKRRVGRKLQEEWACLPNDAPAQEREQRP